MKRIGRLEGAGGVKQAEQRAGVDPGFSARLDAAHRRYARERDSLVPEGTAIRPSGGVAGAAQGVKCLHAHYADHAAGNDNPVGESVAVSVEPLDCLVPCVIDGVANPAWRQP